MIIDPQNSVSVDGLGTYIERRCTCFAPLTLSTFCPPKEDYYLKYYYLNIKIIYLKSDLMVKGGEKLPHLLPDKCVSQKSSFFKIKFKKIQLK